MEIEPRLSVFYVDTPSKDETRGKLNDQIRRYEKRTATAQFAMEQNKVKIEAVDQTIRRLVRAHPELEEEVKKFDFDLERIKLRYEVTYRQNFGISILTFSIFAERITSTRKINRYGRLSRQMQSYRESG